MTANHPQQHFRKVCGKWTLKQDNSRDTHSFNTLQSRGPELELDSLNLEPQTPTLATCKTDNSLMAWPFPLISYLITDRGQKPSSSWAPCPHILNACRLNLLKSSPLFCFLPLWPHRTATSSDPFSAPHHSPRASIPELSPTNQPQWSLILLWKATSSGSGAQYNGSKRLALHMAHLDWIPSIHLAWFLSSESDRNNSEHYWVGK